MRKFVTATVSAALCLASVTPAMAQNYRAEGFDGPRGVNATVNLRVPLGKSSKARAKPTYGLTFGIGKEVGAGMDGRPISKQLTIADLRFSGKGDLARAQLASFDLAHLDRDKRLNMMGGDSGLMTIVVIAAAGAAVCFVITDCFGDDDDDNN